MPGELILPDDEEAVETYRVAIHAQTKHADLWPLVQRLGSNKALAERLHVSQSTVGDWVGLKGFPNFVVNPGVWGPRLEVLYELTGKAFDELWPPALRKAIGEGKAAQKKTIMLEDATAAYALHTRERLELPAHKPAEDADRRRMLEELMANLPENYRRVVELRFLEGHSLTETARLLDRSTERVRQLEIRAIDKMRSRAALLGVMDLPDWCID